MNSLNNIINLRRKCHLFIFPGINLRKVEIQEEKARYQTPATNSVEAILARRIAVELSDSESEGSEDEEDDEDWD